VLKDDLCLKVSDTGPGLPARPSEDRRGVGLSNILHRLETLYQNRYAFDISEAGGRGFTVKIRFPFETAAPKDVETGGMETSAA
jgi:sensor histidine kinase YesM